MSSNPTSGLEKTYTFHHTKERGRGFVVLGEERGSYIKYKVGAGKKILDVGCRDGSLTKYYAKQNEVIGVDIDSEGLDLAKRNLGIATQHLDLNADWAFPEGSFDGVVAAEVLEHLYYPGNVLIKIEHVLKPGGFLVGSIPHAFNAQGRLRLLFGIKQGTPLQDPTHINHFSHREFRALLADRFVNVETKPIVSKKFKLLSHVFPFLFAHTILFYAEKKR